MARDWHRAMLEGTYVPDDAYRGGFRGSAYPALIDYEVTVNGLLVTRASDVAAELDSLISELHNRTVALDSLDAEIETDLLTVAVVEGAIDTCAWLHGEWIRIHPFVNGNGRTARMWVRWVCSRYGLPQLLTLRPRPDMGYNAASFLSITGDHGLFYQYLLVQYNSV